MPSIETNRTLLVLSILLVLHLSVFKVHVTDYVDSAQVPPPSSDPSLPAHMHTGTHAYMYVYDYRRV